MIMRVRIEIIIRIIRIFMIRSNFRLFSCRDKLRVTAELGKLAVCNLEQLTTKDTSVMTLFLVLLFLPFVHEEP